MELVFSLYTVLVIHKNSTPNLPLIYCSYDDLDAPEDEVTVIDYRSL